MSKFFSHIISHIRILLVFFVVVSMDVSAETTAPLSVDDLPPLDFNEEAAHRRTIEYKGREYTIDELKTIANSYPDKYKGDQPNSINWMELKDEERQDGFFFNEIITKDQLIRYSAITGALIAALVLMVILVRIILKASSGDQVSFRVLVVSSSIWFFMALATIKPYEYDEFFGYTKLPNFIYNAIVPLIIIWGAVWIKKGMNKKSENKD